METMMNLYGKHGCGRAWTEVGCVHMLPLAGWTRPSCTFVISSSMAVLLTFVTAERIYTCILSTLRSLITLKLYNFHLALINVCEFHMICNSFI